MMWWKNKTRNEKLPYVMVLLALGVGLMVYAESKSGALNVPEKPAQTQTK
jgi:hypothetical protein